MPSFSRISCPEAAHIISEQEVSIVDVRDERSFASSRIASAQLLHNGNLREFVDNADMEKPVVVYCYHGNSSQGAAQFLADQGFNTVYSVDGGFEAWRQQFPTDSDE